MIQADGPMCKGNHVVFQSRKYNTRYFGKKVAPKKITVL